MDNGKKSLGKIAQIALTIWNIAENALIIALLVLIGILNGLPLYYYPIALVVFLLLKLLFRRIRKSAQSGKVEKFDVKDYSKSDEDVK